MNYIKADLNINSTKFNDDMNQKFDYLFLSGAFNPKLEDNWSFVKSMIEKMFHHCKSRARSNIKVSGVAMNPVDHPHGGGGHKHVGGPSTINRNAPPGRKVGRLSPKKRDKKDKTRRK